MNCPKPDFTLEYIAPEQWPRESINISRTYVHSLSRCLTANGEGRVLLLVIVVIDDFVCYRTCFPGVRKMDQAQLLFDSKRRGSRVAARNRRRRRFHLLTERFLWRQLNGSVEWPLA